MKFNIQANPTFKAKVGIPLHGGGTADIEFTFKHRTAEDFDEFLKECSERFDAAQESKLISDVLVDAVKKEGEGLTATDDTERDRLLSEARGLRERGEQMQSEFKTKRLAADVAYLLGVADGWDADAPFNGETIAQFFTNYQGAPQAIGQAYYLELRQARIKN
jgi:hypothetical protein